MAATTRPTTRKVPKQDRSKAMVEALLEATTRILLREGYELLSTNRVAAEAGVSIGSLYQYFPSKEALLHGVMLRWSEGTMVKVMEFYETMQTADLVTGLKRVVKATIEVSRENPKLHRVLVEQVPKVGALDALEQIYRRFEDLFTLWLELHVDELEVDDPSMAAHFVLRSLLSLTDHALLYRPELLDSTRFARNCERLVLGYLVPSALAAQPRRRR